MAQNSARQIAFAALGEWEQGHRFGDAIIQQAFDGTSLAASDRGFANELFYGVLRNRTLLDFWIGILRAGAIDPESRNLLRLGLLQLLVLRTPGHAAVYETVAIAGKRRRALINGVLRDAQRKVSTLEAAVEDASLATRMSHPEFLVQRWIDAFGEELTAKLCRWNNQPPPLYARVNLLKTNVEQFVAAHPHGASCEWRRDFLQVDAVPLGALGRGQCYMQDPSTSVAGDLLGCQPGDFVLDACAAPGGKTGLLAQQMANVGEIVACDRDAARTELLRGNLGRLGVAIARILQHDWRSGAAFAGATNRLFDRILVDAPCTNTGVMRRRVDVRWRLTPADFQPMHREQLAIVEAVAPLLKPGGTLVYSTCSIEAEENEQVVADICRVLPLLKVVDQRSVLPFRDGFDGAFAAKLQRAS